MIETIGHTTKTVLPPYMVPADAIHIKDRATMGKALGHPAVIVAKIQEEVDGVMQKIIDKLLQTKPIHVVSLDPGKTTVRIIKSNGKISVTIQKEGTLIQSDLSQKFTPENIKIFDTSCELLPEPNGKERIEIEKTVKMAIMQLLRKEQPLLSQPKPPSVNPQPVRSSEQAYAE